MESKTCCYGHVFKADLEKMGTYPLNPPKAIFSV